MGDYPGAERDLQQALELARRNEDPTRRAAVLHDFGRLRSKTGDRAGALGDQQQALEIYEDVGDGLGQTATLIELGLIWPDDDDPGATRYLDRALDQARAAGNLIGQVDALYGLGTRSRAGAGDYDRAMRFLEQSLELARQTGHRLGQAETLEAQSECLARTERAAEAAVCLRRALDIYRGLGLHQRADHVADRWEALGLENTDSPTQGRDA